MLTEFSTFDEIRAVLGVSDEELEDATLVQPMYETYLTLDLEDVAAGLPAEFRTISQIAYASRSAAQKRLYELTRLFSAYAVAKKLLTSLPYFAEQRMGDGRAEKERAPDEFKETRAGVAAGFNDLRLRLSAAYTAVAGGTALTRVTRSYVTSTGLATDPVTNE